MWTVLEENVMPKHLKLKEKDNWLSHQEQISYSFFMKKTFQEVNVFSNDMVYMCDDLVLIPPWVDYGKVFYHTIKMKLRKYVYFDEI